MKDWGGKDTRRDGTEESERWVTSLNFPPKIEDHVCWEILGDVGALHSPPPYGEAGARGGIGPQPCISWRPPSKVSGQGLDYA